MPEVQKRLGIKRFSLGSFSESCRVFEPEHAAGGGGATGRGAAGRSSRHELFRQLPGQADAGGLHADPDAVHGGRGDVPAPWPMGRYRHAWRLHLQLDVDHHVPGAWEITPPKNTGKSDEKNVLRRQAGGRAHLRDGPLVRPVRALERHQGRRQQLRLPGAGQQRLRGAAGAAAGSAGGSGGRGAQRSDRGDRAVQEARASGRTIPRG